MLSDSSCFCVLPTDIGSTVKAIEVATFCSVDLHEILSTESALRIGYLTWHICYMRVTLITYENPTYT